MPPRKIVMLLFAMFIAVGAIVLARQALHPRLDEASLKAEAPQGPQVLVAARDLASGTLLKDSDLKWQVWSEDPKEHMVVKDRGGNKDDFIGALSRSGLKAGEPIINNRVFKTNEQGFLSAALAPGMRAISLKITPVSGVAGLIFPGDHVDVIVAHNVPVPSADGQNRDRRVSETVITNARVLGLDQKTDEKSTEPKLADVATLEVTPKDAEKVALIADWNSTISLVLRSLSDIAAPEKAAEADGLAPPQPIMPGQMPGAPEVEAVLRDSGAAGFTWDSDVSRVLARPDAVTNTSRRVLVIRGKDSSEVSFQQ